MTKSESDSWISMELESVLEWRDCLNLASLFQNTCRNIACSLSFIFTSNWSNSGGRHWSFAEIKHQNTIILILINLIPRFTGGGQILRTRREVLPVADNINNNTRICDIFNFSSAIRGCFSHVYTFLASMTTWSKKLCSNFWKTVWL